MAGAPFLIYLDQGVDQPICASQGTDEPRVLARGDWFWLSADGDCVAFIHGFPNQLSIVSTDGAAERLVYTAPMGSPLIGSVVWAPDGTMVVFSLTCPGCPASQDRGALWGLDIATGASRLLVAEGAHWPLFSPDSRWLSVAAPLGTYVSHGSVGLIDAVEGQGEPALFEDINVWGRVWAADSSGFSVAFTRGAADIAELWWIPTAGEPVKLGELADAWEVLWQPDGERVAYEKAEGGGERRLYLAKRDGSHEVPVPGSEGMLLVPEQFPIWSADGRWLLVVSQQGHFLIDTAGATVHPLDVQAVYGWPEDGWYLAGTVPEDSLAQFEQGEDIPIDIHRCKPLGPCEWLARVPRLARLGYAIR